MQNTRMIEIDFDVHKRLEAERTSFSETANETLRRILKIGNAPKVPEQIFSGRSWSGKGVELPHGTELKMEHNGHQHLGKIVDGKWLVEGREFSTPSGAAIGVAVTKDEKSTSLNGWMYWQVKIPGQSRWVPIRNLKRRQ